MINIKTQNRTDTTVGAYISNGEVVYALDETSILNSMMQNKYYISLSAKGTSVGRANFVKKLDDSQDLYHLDLEDIVMSHNTNVVASIIVSKNTANVAYANYGMSFYINFEVDFDGEFNESVVENIYSRIARVSLDDAYNANSLILLSKNLKSDDYRNYFFLHTQSKTAKFEGVAGENDIGFDLLDHVTYAMIRDFLDNDLYALTRYTDSWHTLLQQTEAQLMKLGYIAKSKTDAEINDIINPQLD